VRTLLRRLGPRTGISVGLILVVAAVLIVGRLAGSDDKRRPYSGPDSLPSVGVSAGDDGLISPTPLEYVDDVDVRAAATAFTQAWLQRSKSPEDWHASLVPLSTATLASSLDGVDPVVVPANRMVGDPTIILRSDLYAQVTVPVDSGVVELGLLKQGGDWLVDTVDWQRI
jgi:hypothetical protein